MTVGEKIPIWLDCDPGNDDAFAILLALFDPRFELLGISTVHGNAPLSYTTHNALSLLDSLGVEPGTVKVYAGSETPLVNAPQSAPEIHGTTGIGGVEFPEVTKNKVATDVGYLEAMKQAILSHENELCLVCTGTLTNVSKLITECPAIIPKIRYVSIMGGAFNLGNVTPYAEFNFYADPHAAKHVLAELGPKIILSPLNITHKATATESIRNQMYDSEDPHRNSDIRNMFYSILMFFSHSYIKKYGITEGPPVHDPLALYCLLPFLQQDKDYKYKYLRRKVSVITEGEHSGESILLNGNSDSSVEEEDGVYIGQDIDVDQFWRTVLRAVNVADVTIKQEINGAQKVMV
ncbi:uridine nucleosidase (uridine ribohydrolase) [Scheffersomyces stipitis CBS 6054]|uniref:Uridine nucleosidase (Uridine ribohydrolase) n=1 Tax=Scheffersomyces stipitis (strain ATCC 58785 / CBS 6054 / NBRC 10063 / NRRL Y-11545) TaxID=322104 RepID=A3LVV3_PICST|nr:uridine nucleosidase (uridine ribohydrolase) [Scheffersomyces stipitis CBS 6054]ABN66847.2 uridine nucleosidase (uridine ribohydrolase) [Scheffersomyces stipitis CBS 6054]KAG2734576.1 hypothetical protein G9P44_002582 [Scheffersomyces stipitis]